VWNKKCSLQTCQSIQPLRELNVSSRVESASDSSVFLRITGLFTPGHICESHSTSKRHGRSIEGDVHPMD
jgi:hypothetical protein